MNFFIIRTNIVQNMGSFQQRKHCPNANKVALIKNIGTGTRTRLSFILKILNMKIENL